MCNNSEDGYNNKHTGNTDVYTDRTIVSKQHSTITTININQWNQRNMESCNNQYINSRNNDLYIYSNSRTVRNNSEDGYCDYKSNHTGLYTDRATLSKQYST